MIDHARFYRFFILLYASVHLFLPVSFSQQSYFVDGYHGGIYGHIPEWQTRFMLLISAYNLISNPRLQPGCCNVKSEWL